MHTRSQTYAKAVYECVEPLKDTGPAKKYGALCYRFPLIVRECGLAAAFGFLAAKAASKAEPGRPPPPPKPEALLLADYARLLGFQDGDTLRETVNEAELGEYRRLTHKTLALAEWFKRYAEGVLKVEPTDEGETGGGHG